MSEIAPATNPSALDVLRSPALTLTQLNRALGELDAAPVRQEIDFGVSAAVTADLLAPWLRRHGYLNATRIRVVAGNYDDPVADVDRFVAAGVQHMLLVPFLDNVLPSFEAQLGSLDEDTLSAAEARMRDRYAIALERARAMKTCLLTTLHRFGRSGDEAGDDRATGVLARFNATLRETAARFPNARIIDSEAVLAEVGRPAAFDERFYFRGKAPYTSRWFDELACRVATATRGFGTYFYKVLALDCDNTLWGGVIGEDLLAGIKLDPHDYPGNVFWRMQHELADLERHGVLLCLCTKNNPPDVEEVLRDHPHMVLRDAQFVAKKINWEDKTSNLRQIARELNVSLDSFVFVDDSSFEIDGVRQQLPMVRTIQVPAILSAYPRVARELRNLFLAGGVTAESQNKTQQYRQRAEAAAAEAAAGNQEEYLASLQLAVALTRNARDSITRISELSQKSNQFNVTTRRYSVAEIENLMARDDRAVYSLVVSDRFGVAGLTGVVVMRYEGGVARVDNFFMSCRVIGRGVEKAIWAPIWADVLARGCSEMHSEYRPSAKNELVSEFFDQLGMVCVSENNGVRHYTARAPSFAVAPPPWIKVTYAG